MTAPESKQLGETEDPKELIPGNVEHIEANVTVLKNEHTRISGRYDSLKAIRVPDWSGNAQQAWEVLYDTEVDRWKDYLKHLEETREAIDTYSGALTTAQGKAQEAIEKWKEGNEATDEAVTTYNQAVKAYNDSLCDPIPVNGPPVIRPAHPGPFQDPGATIRDEAEEILNNAREDLEEAGDTAVEKLRNVDGGKTDAQYDVLGWDGDFEGPKFNIPWFGEETEDDRKYGTDPGDSPWEISLGSGSLRGWLFNSSGEWKDFYGPLGLGADYDLLVGAEGNYHLNIDETGGHAGGELFGGAKIKGGLDGELGPLSGGLDAEGWAGAGIAADADIGYDDGKLRLGGHAGIGWGLGGKLGGDVEIDVPGVIKTGDEILDSIGGLLS